MTEEVRERRYSTNLGNEEENCRCYCQKKRECERPEPKPASIFDYVYQELTWGQRSLSRNDDIYKERCEKVYTFIRIPPQIESLMLYGILCCLDIFISLFTLMPLRCLVNGIKTVLWPIRRALYGPRQIFFQSQVMDFARLGLVLITCMAPWSPLVFSNTSVIYHTIRGQELIKLYIIYNMLEVADRLIASIGQDTMDTFFWSLTHPSAFRLFFHFSFAVLYMFAHSFIMLLQATTLNVAFNNHNKVLLLIMMSNNFIEIKGSVFKKFEKNNLFQVTCADVRERFHLFWLLYIVLIRNLSQRDWSVEAVEDILPYMGIILFAEFIIDWFKHAFIVKFNNLSVYIYEEYREILACEFIKARNPANCVEHADLISRRMAFSPLPLAAVVIRMSRISLLSKLSGSLGVKIVALLFINLFLIKIITGLLLMIKSESYLPSKDDESKNFETIPPKLAECVDPYQQLKRSRSNIELKKDESGSPDKKEPEESVIEESCNTCKMKKLKYHEQKLLKKVNFFDWEFDNSVHENKVMRKYRILKREQYTLYNKLSREIREQIRAIRDLPQKDKFRAYATTKMLDKLYNIGLISTKESLQEAEKVTASAFARRRLPWVMCKLKMAQSLKMATQFIQQGHVRIGPDVCLDESRIISREHEDFVTWRNKSKIRAKLNEYNEERDDFEFEC